MAGSKGCGLGTKAAVTKRDGPEAAGRSFAYFLRAEIPFGADEYQRISPGAAGVLKQWFYPFCAMGDKCASTEGLTDKCTEAGNAGKFRHHCFARLFHGAGKYLLQPGDLYFMAFGETAVQKSDGVYPYLCGFLTEPLGTVYIFGRRHGYVQVKIPERRLLNAFGDAYPAMFRVGIQDDSLVKSAFAVGYHDFRTFTQAKRPQCMLGLFFRQFGMIAYVRGVKYLHR
jgi:hypothetical protein